MFGVRVRYTMLRAVRKPVGVHGSICSVGYAMEYTMGHAMIHHGDTGFPTLGASIPDLGTCDIV